MIPVRLFLIILVLALTFAGAQGMYQSFPIIWDAILQRVANKTPVTQVESFDKDGLYPSIIEAKSEIRPGGDLIIVIRGKDFQEVKNSINVTYKVQTKDTAFVKSINPTLFTVEIEAQTDYILLPINIEVKTNQLVNSPSDIQFSITQEVEAEGEPKIVSDPVLLSIKIDNSPFPMGDVVKALISLLGFLIGVFGTKISIGL